MSRCETPDLMEHVVGFRAWRLVGHALAPIGNGIDTWDGGNEVHAICGYADRFRKRTGVVAFMPAGRQPAPSYAWHEAPHTACECGLYAWHDADAVATGPGRVLGAVAARGAVEVYEHGFRAQFARPVLIAYEREDERASITRLGRRLGIDVCAFDEIAERALEFGQPVGYVLRPSLA